VNHPHAKRLAEAIERLQATDWSGAHGLVQDLDDPVACRIHGLVHRIEGDLDNSRYWYERAGMKLDLARPVQDEIGELSRDVAAAG
jgi:hypothetical protein